MSAHNDLGRRHGVWIPAGEVEAYLAFGWTIVDIPPNCGEVLMAPPADEEDIAA